MRIQSMIFFIGAVAAVGCTSETGSRTTTLSMGFAGLEDLGPDYVYEGWLIVDGAPVSAGRFDIDSSGNPTPDTFEMDAAMVDAATTYVLTIEPAVGDAPEPSPVHILAGDIRGDVIALTTAHAAAIGTDFGSAAGEFILETPTSGAVAEDYAQGIWWIVPGTAGMAPGLDLPELPDGWTYEGWIVGSDGPVSTGTFDAVGQADSDGAGSDAGPDGSPPFPGQDFIDPPRMLTDGYMAVISVEPVPDNSPAPFTIKPLADMSIEDIMPLMTQSMRNIASDTLPSGSVQLSSPE